MGLGLAPGLVEIFRDRRRPRVIGRRPVQTTDSEVSELHTLLVQMRRVRMHRLGQILHGRAHLDGEHAFRDELARAVAHDADAKNAFGLRIDNQFG